MKNARIIKSIIATLNKKLFDEKTGLFNLHYDIKSKKIDKLKTVFAEAHCIHCLYEIGYKKQAEKMLLTLMKSKLFCEKDYIFRFSIKNGRIFNSDKNGCSNLLMIRNLAEMGYKKQAEKLFETVTKNLFNKKIGLFVRSSRDKNLFVAQTNLWAIAALESLKKEKEIKELIKKILKRFYDKNLGLLVSSSSTKEHKYKLSFIFSDDNLLFCYLVKKYYPKLCEKICKKIIKSELFDKEKWLFNRSLRLNDNYLNTDKSTYKNALCLLGLKTMKSSLAKKVERGMLEHLYNKKLKLFIDCFSDSNLLACLALSK